MQSNIYYRKHIIYTLIIYIYIRNTISRIQLYIVINTFKKPSSTWRQLCHLD